MLEHSTHHDFVLSRTYEQAQKIILLLLTSRIFKNLSFISRTIVVTPSHTQFKFLQCLKKSKKCTRLQVARSGGAALSVVMSDREDDGCWEASDKNYLGNGIKFVITTGVRNIMLIQRCIVIYVFENFFFLFSPLLYCFNYSQF